MHKIDLHLHSHYSDGKSSCRDLIRLAAKSKVEMVSVTDHDTLAGLEESIEAAKEFSIPYICGVEISTNVEDMLHVLGYGINARDEKFAKFLEFCRRKRFERIEAIVKALNRHGLSVKLSEVSDIVKSSPSRVHVANIIVEKGYAFSRGEAFRKFLLPQSPTYVRPQGVSAKEAISAISDAEGLAVLAHPGVIKTSYNLSQWIDCGLKGIEVFYPKHSQVQTQSYLDIASKYNLLATGGSDFHGPGCGFAEHVGVKVTREIFDAIKEKLSSGRIF
jgi:predicted metal-dependent phosphoesterase TrpH